MFISPMLLEKASEPFNDDSYISQLKLDGFRFIYSYLQQKKFYTRHQTDITYRYKELLDLPLTEGIILDGELIATDDNGKPDFEKVMRRFQSSSSSIPVHFSAFDILYYKGKKITHWPLLERLELLKTIIPNNHPSISYVRWVIGNGVPYFNAVKEQGLEGIVLKHAQSVYEVGKRSNRWLKVINYQYTDVMVTGYRKSKFGLLLASLETHQSLGIMEFMPLIARKEFYNKVRSLKLYEKDDFVYIQPIFIKVKYRNVTSKQLLRIPSFESFINKGPSLQTF